MARTRFKDTWNGIHLILYLMEYNLSLESSRIFLIWTFLEYGKHGLKN